MSTTLCGDNVGRVLSGGGQAVPVTRHSKGRMAQAPSGSREDGRLTRAAVRPRRAHDFDRASPSTSWKIASLRPRLMWLPTYDSEVVEIARPVRSPMIAAVACMLVNSRGSAGHRQRPTVVTDDEGAVTGNVDIRVRDRPHLTVDRDLAVGHHLQAARGGNRLDGEARGPHRRVGDENRAIDGESRRLLDALDGGVLVDRDAEPVEGAQQADGGPSCPASRPVRRWWRG